MLWLTIAAKRTHHEMGIVTQVKNRTASRDAAWFNEERLI